MGKKINLIGRRFGRLVVCKEAGKTKNGIYKWLCKCDCGGSATIPVSSLLRSKGTKSCGCLSIERTTTHGKSDTPEYTVWESMLQRCYNPKAEGFLYYGGRGILVCEEWKNSFPFFLKDMGKRPDKTYTIDRINNNKDYSKVNCRWANPTQQALNRGIRKDNKSGVIGVSFNKRTNKYVSYINIKHKNIHLGYFSATEQASFARKEAEERYWRDFV